MYVDYDWIIKTVLMGEPTEGDANSERSVCCERNYELIQLGRIAPARWMRVIQEIEPGRRPCELLPLNAEVEVEGLHC